MNVGIRVRGLGTLPSEGRAQYFHVRKQARDAMGLANELFAIRGDVLFIDFRHAFEFAETFNRVHGLEGAAMLGASQVHAMGLVHEVLHAVVAMYKHAVGSAPFDALAAKLGDDLAPTLEAFLSEFPPPAVYEGKQTPREFLQGSEEGIANTQWALEELLLLYVTNQNPAYEKLAPVVSDAELRKKTRYTELLSRVSVHFDEQPRFGPAGDTLLDLLLAPARHAPSSLADQIEFMRKTWGLELSRHGAWMRLLLGADTFAEEAKWLPRQGHETAYEGGTEAPTFHSEFYEREEARFTRDRAWMPNVVMLAKSTFVWLEQLSRTYGAAITTLSQIPDAELDLIASRGITALWLIGVWKRSHASRRIKERAGLLDPAASAYSLDAYDIADELGGYDAYRDLAERAGKRGIRLASDMVPNHMGIDSQWVMDKPEYFVQASEPPYPSYRFDGPDLSEDPRAAIFLEEGYYARTDAAVVFKRVDRASGETRFMYHGNDGTSMPWNDTAQLDYTSAEVREAVMETILHVAKMFPIIRFDAAMTLAKKHYQRLWFPVPGSGGDIPSRSRWAMPKAQFDEVFPNEFWRDVVDRVSVEAPDTLLLAEAFWLMEGYFVRTLGMHRVYNSAFMNMLKREENAHFRASIRNVLEFEPEILRRHVNFMNNPDEETALAQFGRDDKYFGTCTLLATTPGLPMFGHGQIEGFREKYGMEYRRARIDETQDDDLVARHEREIFPLLKKRALFAEVTDYFLFDFVTEDGSVDEDVIAQTNLLGDERALVVVHNKFKETRGALRLSVPFRVPSGSLEHRSITQALRLSVEAGGFVITKSSPSGLEHLFDVQKLEARGWELSLRPFEYQVFLEFRNVVSTEARPYARLAEELGGRGVPSVEAALDALIAPPREAVAGEPEPTKTQPQQASIDRLETEEGTMIETKDGALSGTEKDEEKETEKLEAGETEETEEDEKELPHTD